MSDTSTPLLKQYHAIKQQHPGAILLYRMGDFFEMFDDDAVIASKVLGLTLTARNHGGAEKTPLAGFPHHALERYSAKLLAAGYRIAICEQTEDPKLAKGIVKRDVIEVVTAGTAIDACFLEEGKNNYLAAVVGKSGNFGCAVLEVSTGEFFVFEQNEKSFWDELARLAPAEILVPDDGDPAGDQRIQRLVGGALTPFSGWRFSAQQAQRTLSEHFGVATLEAFGILSLPAALAAAGAVLAYAKEQKKSGLTHVRALRIKAESDEMILDASTLRNLELLNPSDGESHNATLFAVLNQTKTSMGARLLRRWIVRPLIRVEQIRDRLEAVEALVGRALSRKDLSASLERIGDIERIVGRLGTERAHARDLIGLKDSLRQFPAIAKALDGLTPALLSRITGRIDGFGELAELIETSLVEAPPLSLREGGLIRPGFNADLDGIKAGIHGGKEWIAQLQPQERKRTGIPSLKVGFNKVFGYYIEVSNSNLHLVPTDYIRKQTLVNGERFITPELKDWESKVLGAEERIREMEYELFLALRKQVCAWNDRLQEAALRISELDALCAFAQASERGRYAKPVVDDGNRIWIEDGRHPVVEHLNPMEPFVPNDTILDNQKNQILLITGPNMAGKSTYLRQVALIVLMAQIGCYVPARSAQIGVADRIFTRVGASDRLAKGQSTFLVEMTEVATILRNATWRSLILLDEVGRGTSTFDGLSIAWSVAEYLHENSAVAAKTLFATHYHELVELAFLFPRVRNYNVQVKEWNDRVVFLRKIVEGSCDHSYGIEVARLAGVPAAVLERAREILHNLEASELTIDRRPALARREPPVEAARQMDLFAPTALTAAQLGVLETVRNLALDHLTPLEALSRLSEMQKNLKD